MKEFLNSLFIYIDGDIYWRRNSRKGFNKSGMKAGTLNKGYLWVKSKLLPVKNMSVHRIIWIMHYGDIPKELVIDHKDINPLNNRIENLRLATKSDNSINTNGKSKKKSKLPKNVYVDFTWKGITKYRKQCVRKGKVLYKGNFNTPKEAERYKL